MIALDTNVLARYLLNDDAAQAEAAEALLSSGERFFVPLTVWLDLVWVLELRMVGHAHPTAYSRKE